jgi:hypothetical protein
MNKVYQEWNMNVEYLIAWTWMPGQDFVVFQENTPYSLPFIHSYASSSTIPPPPPPPPPDLLLPSRGQFCSIYLYVYECMQLNWQSLIAVFSSWQDDDSYSGLSTVNVSFFVCTFSLWCALSPSVFYRTYLRKDTCTLRRLKIGMRNIFFNCN